MPKPKLYTKSELRKRKRARNRAGMAIARRVARGLPMDAPRYAGIQGPLHGGAKLTAADLEKAREMREAGHTVTGLAERFGVAKSTMSAALRRKTGRKP